MRCLAVLFLATAVFAAGVCRAGEEEEPVVKEIVVVGNTLINENDIKYRMRTREGDKLDRKVLDEDLKRLWNMGNFADAQIREEAIDGGVRLRVLVREKQIVRRIEFRGNKQVSRRNCRGQISTKVGDNYDPGAVNRDVRALEDWYHDQFYYFTAVKAASEPFEDGVRLVFDIDEGGRVTVKDFVFRGNENVKKKELLKDLQTRKSGFILRGKYERKAFEQDLERIKLLYQSKGYLDVEVKEMPFQITDRAPDSRFKKRDLIIHIDIVEGERYTLGGIAFDGNGIYDDEALRKLVESMPGEAYNPVQIATDSKAIRDKYGEQGRIFTKVIPERVLSQEGTVLDVVFRIAEGEQVTVQDVLITGNVRTQDRVIRRSLEILPGELYNTTKVEESRTALNRLGFFEKPIGIEAKETDDPTRASVVVDVKEQKTGSIVLGAGVSSADGVFGSIGLHQRNFNHKGWPSSLKDFVNGKAFTGAGEKFDVNLQKGTKTDKYTVDFMNPWIFDKPIRFGTGFFYTTHDWSAYTEERLGGYLLLGRRIFNKNWDISSKYKLERVSLTDMDEDECSQDLLEEKGEAWISRTVFRLQYDTRDDLYDPTKGWYAGVNQEFAGGPLGGDKDFWRTYGDVNYFWTFMKDKQKRPHTLAFRLEGGTEDSYGDTEKVPTYERYYLGGIGSLRGFDTHGVSPQDCYGNAIGGTEYASASIEYLFPIFKDVFRGSVFYDLGNVWSDYGTPTNGEVYDDSDWRSSVGFGIHIKTPISPMPIRVYVAKAITKEDGDDTATILFTFGAFF